MLSTHIPKIVTLDLAHFSFKNGEVVRRGGKRGRRPDAVALGPAHAPALDDRLWLWASSLRGSMML
jgi:hypothetical protein